MTAKAKPSKKASNAKRTNTPAGGRSTRRIQAAKKAAAKTPAKAPKVAAAAAKPAPVPEAPKSRSDLAAAANEGEALVVGQVVRITDRFSPAVGEIGEVVSIQGRGDGHCSVISVLIASGHVTKVFRDGCMPGSSEEISRWLIGHGHLKEQVFPGINTRDKSSPESRKPSTRARNAVVVLVVAVVAVIVWISL